MEGNKEQSHELYQELCQQGLALMHSKCPKEAHSYFEKALQANPDYHKAYHYQGLALHRLGNWEKALSSYDSALKIKPDCYEVWSDRGYTLSLLGRYEEAIVSYYKALEINPNYLEAQNHMEIALQDCHRAKKNFKYPQASLEPEADIYDSLNTQDGVQSELNQYDLEIDNYDSKVEEIGIIRDRLRHLWFKRSDALIRLERYQEALSSYETALGILQGKPIDYCSFRGVIPQALHNQGVALYYLGDAKRAIVKYNEALEKGWRYPSPLYGRALSLVKLEQVEEAIASLDKALEISPCYAAAWYTKGTLLEKLGFEREAISCYRKVLDISRAFNNEELQLVATQRLNILQDNHR